MRRAPGGIVPGDLLGRVSPQAHAVYSGPESQRILAGVAEMFRDVSAAQISDLSHARKGPWDAARKRGGGKWGTPIRYLDSANLDLATGKAMSKGELAERAVEYEELWKHFA